MGLLDTILSQVLNPQGNSPLVSDLEKAAADAITASKTPMTTEPTTKTDDTTTPDDTGSDSDAPTGDTTPPAKVDVAATLDKLQDEADQDLDWRKSIVDLLKLLGQDSSLAARKQLASELDYDGDTDDSAAMNIWLHGAVMQKLADNGGKLPDNL